MVNLEKGVDLKGPAKSWWTLVVLLHTRSWGLLDSTMSNIGVWPSGMLLKASSKQQCHVLFMSQVAVSCYVYTDRQQCSLVLYWCYTTTKRRLPYR